MSQNFSYVLVQCQVLQHLSNLLGVQVCRVKLLSLFFFLSYLVKNIIITLWHKSLLFNELRLWLVNEVGRCKWLLKVKHYFWHFRCRWKFRFWQIELWYRRLSVLWFRLKICSFFWCLLINIIVFVYLFANLIPIIIFLLILPDYLGLLLCWFLLLSFLDNLRLFHCMWFLDFDLLFLSLFNLNWRPFSYLLRIPLFLNLTLIATIIT